MRIRAFIVFVLMILVSLPVDAQTPVPATPAPIPNMTRGEQPVIQTLAGLKVSVVAGAAANTNITVTGITTADSILSVLQVEPDNGTAATMLTNRTTETWISGAGTIKLTTTATTGKQLLIFWYDHDSYSVGP